MGWNSWNHFERKVDDKTVREAADAMVSSGMKAAGYLYINIDDSWEGDRDAEGNITSNSKFPDMKALADYVHSKGLKIGIYSSPGRTTCAGYEGSYGHELQDARTYAQWGIDYLKYDYCNASAIYPIFDMRGVYQKMGEALRSAGRPIVYSLSAGGLDEVWTWGAKAGLNLWRTTPDIRPTWYWMSRIAFNQLPLSRYPSPGHWNDPDMLEVGNGLSEEESRTQMTLWSMLRAPLIAGNDLTNMTEATRNILMNRDMISVDQDVAAKPAHLLRQQDAVQIWTRRLSDGSTAIAIINAGGSVTSVTLKWKEAGLMRIKKVRDIWRQQDITGSKQGFSSEIPPHGIEFLRVW